MGATIWVDVQGRADDETPADNSMMLQLEKQLDKLARKIGGEKLTSFYDYSAAEDDLADLLDDAGDDEAGDADVTTDPDESAPARGNWFDPSAALASIRAIYEHLQVHPADLGMKLDASRSHWPAQLMNELEQIQATLQDAVSRKRKFRFLLVS